MHAVQRALDFVSLKRKEHEDSHNGNKPLDNTIATNIVTNKIGDDGEEQTNESS